MITLKLILAIIFGLTLLIGFGFILIIELREKNDLNERIKQNKNS